MPEFKSAIQLSKLSETTGFQINGELVGDRSGQAVSWAGDLNGDGLGDIIIGAPTYAYDVGATYVVFGKAGTRPDVELASLNGKNGFQLLIQKQIFGTEIGFSVADAGDVNGDGFADIVTGAPFSDSNGTARGETFVVFGKSRAFSSEVNVSTLNGENGFKIIGERGAGNSGYSVSSVGDFNGDNINDILIGATHAAAHGLGTGAAYVVFGRSAGFSSSLNLAALNGSNGFQLNGEIADDRAGYSVSSAGDINGDGRDDILVGTASAYPFGNDDSKAYVIFGRKTAFEKNFELHALNGRNGFKIDNLYDANPSCISTAGDVNGDGFDDIVVGARQSFGNVQPKTGECYVIFGHRSGFQATIDIGSLEGTEGFEIKATASDYYFGTSVAGAGDINGDGFDDLVIRGYTRGIEDRTNSAQYYVVFGQSGGFGTEFQISSLDGSNGFRIDSSSVYSSYGVRKSTASASGGDVNGDGFDDVIIGARAASPNGVSSGSTYVIYGHRAETAVQRSGTYTDNKINGGMGADTIDGLDGNDVLIGWESNDLLNGGDGNDTINGGTGSDTITASTGADRYNGWSGRDTLIFDQFQELLLFVDLESGIARTKNDGGQIFTSIIANVEHLSGSSAAERFYGSSDANAMLGFGGVDIVLGREGDDRINGGAGDDRLNGGAGEDRLNGGAGDDRLNGGAGDDRLMGGDGIDWFDYASIADSGTAAVARDSITDFQSGVDDIRLAPIDANTKVAGNQAFEFIGSAAFTGNASDLQQRGELRFLASNAQQKSFVFGDVNGDKLADFAIAFQGVINLQLGDFVL